MPLSFISDQFIILILISVRVLVILNFTPIVSSPQVPFFIRLVLAAFFAFILRYTNAIKLDFIQVPSDFLTFIVLVIGEGLIGLIIGFYIQMVYYFLSVITEFFSTLMGIQAAQVLDPLTGTESVILSQFFSVLVMMVFLSSYTLQKIFYYGIVQSYMALSTQMIFSHKDQNFISMIFFGFAKLFERSFLIALPMFISLLLVNIGLGLFGKVAPQMNLLVLGLPIQIALGIAFLILLLPNIIHFMESIFDYMIQYLSLMIRGLKI